MADQTIIASQDTYLDEGNSTADRSDIDHLNFRVSGALEINPLFQFDCSSLDGMTWDSVVLKMTWRDNDTGYATPANACWLSYILRTDMTIDAVSWDNRIEPGSAWNTAGAEDSTDNDHTTRVEWDLSANMVADATVTSPDLGTIVQKALDENSGILNLLLYATGTATNVSVIKSLEAVGISEAEKPQLFFSGVQEASSSSSGGSSATNDPSGSVAVSTKSSRPPVSEPGRMTTASVFHNGVEPMTILALITKSEYGRDA